MQTIIIGVCRYIFLLKLVPLALLGFFYLCLERSTKWGRFSLAC